MKLLCVAILFFHSAPLAVCQGLLLDHVDPQFQNTKLQYDEKYGKVIGSVFYEGDEAIPADIYLSGGTVKENVNVHYDLVEDLILFEDEKGDLMVLNTNHVSGFLLKGKGGHALFRKFTGKGVSGFCQILFEGKLSFLAKLSKEIVKAEATATGYSTSKNVSDKVREVNKYYLTDGERFVMLDGINRKSVTKAFEELNVALPSQLNEKGAKVKKEEDVIEILEVLEK